MPAQFAPTQRTQSMSFNDALLGSNFDLSLSSGTNNHNKKRPMTLWGRIATSSFDGEPSGSLSLDGDLTTGYLGLDFRKDWGLLGVAVSYSEGEGDFRHRGNSVGDIATGDYSITGELDTSLSSIYPYLRWSPSTSLDVWGLLGFGAGDLELVYGMGDAVATNAAATTETHDIKTDVEMHMIALGLRGVLPSVGALELAIKADAFAVQMQSDVVRGQFNDGDAALLNKTDSAVQRLRLILEANRSWALSEDSLLTPSLELGVRWDEGDADTGLGTELGGSMTWRHTRLGLDLSARARVLLDHEQSGYKEWGASLSFRKALGSDGQGLAFALTPTWGQASSGVNSLWSRAPGAPAGSYSLTGAGWLER